MISAVDDSENVTVFFIDTQGRQASSYTCNLRTQEKNSWVREKHLFALGYAYLICGYANHVTVSTDYGIALLQIPSRM